EGVSVGCWNDFAVRRRAAFGSGEIEPSAEFSARNLHVVNAHVDVALRVIAVLSGDVGPRAGKESERHPADLDLHILDSASVAAHVEEVEIVNVDVLASVITFAGPEFCVRLALQNISGLNECFAQSELVVEAELVVEV